MMVLYRAKPCKKSKIYTNFWLFSRMDKKFFTIHFQPFVTFFFWSQLRLVCTKYMIMPQKSQKKISLFNFIFPKNVQIFGVLWFNLSFVILYLIQLFSKHSMSQKKKYKILQPVNKKRGFAFGVESSQLD